MHIIYYFSSLASRYSDSSARPEGRLPPRIVTRHNCSTIGQLNFLKLLPIAWSLLLLNFSCFKQMRRHTMKTDANSSDFSFSFSRSTYTSRGLPRVWVRPISLSSVNSSKKAISEKWASSFCTWHQEALRWSFLFFEMALRHWYHMVDIVPCFWIQYLLNCK